MCHKTDNDTVIFVFGRIFKEIFIIFSLFGVFLFSKKQTETKKRENKFLSFLS
jgi:hypothetical protein